MSSVSSCFRFAEFSSVLVLHVEPKSSSTGMVRAPSSVVARPPADMFLGQDCTVPYAECPFSGRSFVDYQALVTSETNPDIAQFLRRVDSFLVPGHCKLALVSFEEYRKLLGY